MGRMIAFKDAIGEALAEEMERDDRVLVFGEDITSGIMGVTQGLHERFGGRRVFDTPISEGLIVGAGVGAALTGLRPVVELQFADFVACAMDELYNKAAKWRYMHGGMLSVPLVVRAFEGAAFGIGPEHSQSPEGLFWSAPGLYVLTPSTPADAKGLLKAAIRDDNPVLFLEHKRLFAVKGEVPEGDYVIPLGQAEVRRTGTDVTVVAWSWMVHKALKAAAQVEEELGVSVEVIDPRGIRPLDMETILKSVEKTGRVILAHEAGKSGGPGSEVAAIIAEQALDLLSAPIKRVAALDVPLPQNADLERFVVPGTPDIAQAIKEIIV
jgi:pyruvate dehydrogenase E1 component beta subunit